ncbi:MAG TPA: hypothetical protein VFV38_33170 [Ktedonobacteraceae bacterium]|nr:hypothetical protein [Ktedonobacteraceae bacterium]
MDAEQLHFPDFIAPDFSQPTLQETDLVQAGFTLPDPARPELPVVEQPSLWPAEMLRPQSERPDPALPDLTAPEFPADLTQPATDTHMLSRPEYAPEVIMDQRPGELDPAAAEILLASPDMAELPQALTYPQLYTSDDEINTRKRHLGMLELGLEQNARDE